MKKWYESKTLWFAILYGLVSVAGLFGYLDYSPTEDVTEIVGVVVSIVMLILRFATSKKITL